MQLHPVTSIVSKSSNVNSVALTRQIPLTQGLFALVDEADYEQLARSKWCAQKNGRQVYAARQINKRSNKRRVLMHRVIMNAPAGVEVDHINGDGLDNRRSNLRLASRIENSRNRRLGKNNTSGYKGVCWNNQQDKWQARIHMGGQEIHLGLFDDKTDAALAYNIAALELHGPFARLNEIEWQNG